MFADFALGSFLAVIIAVPHLGPVHNHFADHWWSCLKLK